MTPCHNGFTNQFCVNNLHNIRRQGVSYWTPLAVCEFTLCLLSASYGIPSGKPQEAEGHSQNFTTTFTGKWSERVSVPAVSTSEDSTSTGAASFQAKT